MTIRGVESVELGPRISPLRLGDGIGQEVKPETVVCLSIRHEPSGRLHRMVVKIISGDKVKVVSYDEDRAGNPISIRFLNGQKINTDFLVSRKLRWLPDGG